MTTLAARVGALAETTALPDPGPISDGEARFVVSWDQTDEDVDALCTALGALPKNATA